MGHHTPSIFKVIEFIQDLDQIQERNIGQLCKKVQLLNERSLHTSVLILLYNDLLSKHLQKALFRTSNKY